MHRYPHLSPSTERGLCWLRPLLSACSRPAPRTVSFLSLHRANTQITLNIRELLSEHQEQQRQNNGTYDPLDHWYTPPFKSARATLIREPGLCSLSRI